MANTMAHLPFQHLYIINGYAYACLDASWQMCLTTACLNGVAAPDTACCQTQPRRRRQPARSRLFATRGANPQAGLPLETQLLITAHLDDVDLEAVRLTCHDGSRMGAAAIRRASVRRWRKNSIAGMLPPARLSDTFTGAHARVMPLQRLAAVAACGVA